MATKTADKKPNLTLVEFVRAEKRATCNVCKLPVEIRGQLGRSASEKRIPREQQLKWLALVTGQAITMDELNEHNTGRHDVA